MYLSPIYLIRQTLHNCKQITDTFINDHLKAAILFSPGICIHCLIPFIILKGRRSLKRAVFGLHRVLALKPYGLEIKVEICSAFWVHSGTKAFSLSQINVFSSEGFSDTAVFTPTGQCLAIYCYWPCRLSK